MSDASFHLEETDGVFMVSNDRFREKLPLNGNFL